MSNTMDTNALASRLHTKHAYPAADSLYLDMLDATNEIIGTSHWPLEREARALRDMINHDLLRIIRQVEREAVDAALVEVHQIARAEQAKRQESATMSSDQFHTPTEHADNLLVLLDDMGVVEKVRSAQPTLDTACFDLTQSHDPRVKALGYTLGLTAVLETPGALEQAVRALRARLAEGLPVV